ncbi:DUF4214 domain-containing protein [Rugamonas rivuli]|uniref:DUF4214 domain-containing protein n=1 Tax=Rugamonas rivuli TaxID=2743358 RepID=A0A843SGD0_9BURK|nr:DUF4214 domain-containing protein [Rugamonas rivuli]MQA23349.1 DUF4214 domain-containing protein [Rugamonas rivuli]
MIILHDTSIDDDVGNQPDSATQLAIGASANGKLEVATDIDVYKVSVIAGQVYAFQLQHDGLPSQWPSLAVTDAQSKPLGLLSPGSVDGYKLYTATSTGDVYLNVSEDRNYQPVGYTLSAVSLGADDYGNDQKSAGSVAIGGQAKGALSYAGDVDLIKVALKQGTTYQFDLQAGDIGGLNPQYTYVFELYDAKGKYVASYDNSFSYKAAGTGDYFLSIKADQVDAAATGSYIVSTSAQDAAPLLAGPVAGGVARLGLTDALSLDFDQKILAPDGSGITLTDAAGNEIPLAEILSVSGSHLTIDPLVHLAPGTRYTLDIAADAISNLNGTGYAGLHYTFTTVAAAATGTAGNDILIGKENGAAIHGRAGTDTVIYAGNAGNYDILQRNGHAEIKPVNGSGGTDILDGVERLLFDDKTVALDIDGVGGKAYRLYQAAFNRAPDESGLGYWIANMDKGLSLQATAGFFIGSEEFGRRYGANLSDADFVTQLYNNVLHRAPDAGGHAYWLHDLQIGVPRANVLANFSESPENQAALVQVIGNGFSYLPYSV